MDWHTHTHTHTLRHTPIHTHANTHTHILHYYLFRVYLNRDGYKNIDKLEQSSMYASVFLAKAPPPHTHTHTKSHACTQMPTYNHTHNHTHTHILTDTSRNACKNESGPYLMKGQETVFVRINFNSSFSQRTPPPRCVSTHTLWPKWQSTDRPLGRKRRRKRRRRRRRKEEESVTEGCSGRG